MKCERCGYTNSEFDIICNGCGSPLNIENNIELKKKYSLKTKAIDIEEMVPEQSNRHFNNTKKKVKKIIVLFLALIFLFLIVFIGIIFKEVRTNDVLTKYQEFMNTTDLGIIYLGKERDMNELLNSYSESYEFDYLYISTEKLTSIKKNRIKDDLKLNEINSTIVIVKEGKVIDYLHNINYDESEHAINMLQNNELLPKAIGEPKEVISNFEEALKQKNPVVIYIANNKNDSNEEHHQKIRNFCEEYSINYVYIEGYYLSDNQKLRILRRLNYSEIHDELIVLVDEGVVKEVSEFVPNNSSAYFDLMDNYGIIDSSSAESLEKIDLNKLKTLVVGKEKAIIMFGTDDCVYCDRLKPIVGKIGIQNNINIYYFNLDDNELIAVEEYLKTLGYKEGTIIVPLVIITENNQLLDYIIGLSDKTLYEEKFIELGVIR